MANLRFCTAEACASHYPSMGVWGSAGPSPSRVGHGGVGGGRGAQAPGAASKHPRDSPQA